MVFNETEQEAIILHAIWGMIDDMVNFAIFAKPHSRNYDVQLMPKSRDTLRLFHILLVDFLSPLNADRTGPTKGQLPFNLPAPPSGARSSDLTYLFYLRRVHAAPRLAEKSPALKDSLDRFSEWLEGSSVVPRVDLPPIEGPVDLTIERKSWIKICGDIGKHNFARLQGNVSRLVGLLGRHDIVIDEGMGYLLLPWFWDRFHDDVFAYHASSIAEFLNNIRWAIHMYLLPEFHRSHRLIDDDGMYEYLYPEGIVHPLARSMYEVVPVFWTGV
jgi:hypothetical protein